MNADLVAVLVVLGAYLIGSVSFAVVMSRIFCLPDPHTYGSKNPGATNVLRTGNKAAAVLTLLGDAGKGFVAVVLAKLITGEGIAASLIVPLAGSFDVHLDDGRERKTIHLRRANQGLLLPTMIWREINNFSSGSVCLVLASEHYDEADYFRSYDDFKASVLGSKS